jgi:sphinganine-1-phosphate aldolase
MDFEKLLRELYPYADEYGVARALPEVGIPDDALRTQLEKMAGKENKIWEQGLCSGTMYCGDHAHYAFMNACFALFSHVNALQRDMCLSMNRFESEIIAMTAGLFHGDAVTERDPMHKACGVIGSGGTESILNAMIAYRERARQEKGIDRPEMLCPTTAHSAFRKAAHLFGYELIDVPVDPVTTQADVQFVRDHVSPRTGVIIASAGNYPYGTVDPISELSEIAVAHDIPMHIDGCFGGFILPWAEQLEISVPRFDFRVPGVTSISADTHKFGYGLKGCSVLIYRDKSYRNYQYFLDPGWPGGTYASPGLLGSRSGGLIAATWAGMMRLGKAGYLERAKRIYETAFRMQDAVKREPALRLLGSPTFCFAFASEEFNVYHVNDFMRSRGWRFNGLQRPDALHMCVTGPQTLPGVAERFAEDLPAAVAYAKAPPASAPKSSPMYGFSAGDGFDFGDPMIAKMVLTGALDALVEYPF